MSKVTQGNIKRKSKLNPGAYMSEHGVFRALIKISLPIIFLMLADATYAVFDSAMASNYVEYGDGINAGDLLSFVQPMMGMFLSFNMLFIVGTTLAFTKSIAKNDTEEAKREFGNGIVSGAVLSGAMIMIVYFVADPMIRSFSSIGVPLPDNVIQEGVIYARLTIVSISMMAFRDQMGRALRTEGYGTHYSLINMTAIPINLLLNWAFMAHLGTGVEGAAYATLIATFVGLVGNLILLINLKVKNKTIISFSPKYLKPKFSVIWIIVIFGLSSMLRRITTSIYMLNYIGLANSFGDNWKQWTNASRLAMRFTNQLSLGAAQGAAILLSFAHNKNDGNKVKEVSVKATWIIVTIQATMLIVLNTAAHQIMLLFNMTKITSQMMNAWYLTTSAWFLNSLMYIPIIYFATTKMVKESLIQAFVQSILFGLGIPHLMYGAYIWTGSVNTDIFFSFGLIASSLSLLTIYPWFNKIIRTKYI